MRVTDTGIYLQQLVMVHSYTRYLHMVYSLLFICKHEGYLSKTYVVFICGKYNTSVHRQEYSTKMLLLVLSIKMSTINLKLDYICTSLHSPFLSGLMLDWKIAFTVMVLYHIII